MICKNCGKEHDGSFGSGKFCSRACANTRHHSEETKQKIAETLTKKYKPIKKYYCKNCGKEHDGSFGSGKFCSRACANTRHHLEETKRKISEAFAKKTKPIKKYYCKTCGKEITEFDSKTVCSLKCQRLRRIMPTLSKYFNFDLSTEGTIKVFNELDRITNELYDLYWNQHKSSTEICKIYNYPNVGNLTAKLFFYLGIKSKSCQESQHENILMGRVDPLSGFVGGTFKSVHQWYTTWNNKKVYLRSTHELKYAQELDEQKIDYDVEGLRIKYWDSQKQEFRCAIPDFYIPSQNMIVEIKSIWTLDKQNMIDKKKAYIENGYKFKCICDFVEIDI